MTAATTQGTRTTVEVVLGREIELNITEGRSVDRG